MVGLSAGFIKREVERRTEVVMQLCRKILVQLVQRKKKLKRAKEKKEMEKQGKGLKKAMRKV
jgi:hypothetical protein